MDAGVNLGPRTMATDGSQLFVGGDFTTSTASPSRVSRGSSRTTDTATPKPTAPIVNALSSTSVEVSVEAPLDIDDPDLTLELFRNGGTTPIAIDRGHVVLLEAADRQLDRQRPRRRNRLLHGEGARDRRLRGRTDRCLDGDEGHHPGDRGQLRGGGGRRPAPSSFWQLNEAKGLVAGDASGSASGQGGV